jgi:hypothetical protein
MKFALSERRLDERLTRSHYPSGTSGCGHFTKSIGVVPTTVLIAHVRKRVANCKSIDIDLDPGLL